MPIHYIAGAVFLGANSLHTLIAKLLVSQLKLLEHLDLSSNCFTDLPPALVENHLLKTLEAKDNGLGLLPEETTHHGYGHATFHY